ncbi:MAG: phosphatidate cytidylyltransferase [Microbacterium sp.]
MSSTPDADDERSSSLRDRARDARDEFEQQAHQAREHFEEVNERIKQRSGRDLLSAIGVGVVAGVVAVAAVLIADWTFAIFVVAVAALGVHELWGAFRNGGRRIDLVPQLIGAVAIPAATYGGGWLHWSSLFLTMAFIVIWRLMAQMAAQDGRSARDVIADLFAGAFIPLYVPYLGSIALQLRQLDDGATWILSFLIVAVVVDVAAFAAGRSLGRHKMSPHISPNKTWEGFIGAAVAALGAGALLGWLLLGIPWWAGLIFGAVILITATIGDLAESMIKRDLGIKDMSSLLPGHGGVLDRLDSILLSAAAALALHFLLGGL